MDIVFETKRLYLRKFTMSDAALIYELNKDPVVIKYVHEPATTLHTAPGILANIILPQYEKYNHGRWAVHLKDTSEFIGWCGLKQTDEHNYPDLGYRFMQKYWGAGYATEAALQTVEYGFTTLNLPGIYAAVHIENIASQKVLEKCGMHFNTINDKDGAMIRTFELANNRT